MLLIREEKGKFYKVEDVLGSKFDLRDVRSAEKMLGIDITRDKKKNSVLQSQSGYLGSSVEEFSMDGAMANPEKKGHWSEMKWRIRYIGGPLELGLRYVKHSNQIEVEGFITSDYASDRERRKLRKRSSKLRRHLPRRIKLTWEQSLSLLASSNAILTCKCLTMGD